MDENSLLEYLYNNNNSSNYTNLLDYFISEFPEESDSNLRHIKLMLYHLIKSKFINLSDETTYYSLGKITPLNGNDSYIYPNNVIARKLTLKELKRRVDTSVYEIDGIKARISPLGKKEVEERLFRNEIIMVNKSVRDTNQSNIRTNRISILNMRFTRASTRINLWIAGLTGLFILGTLITSGISIYLQTKQVEKSEGEKLQMDIKSISISLQKINASLDSIRTDTFLIKRKK